MKDNKTDQEQRGLSDKMNAIQAAAYLDLEVSTIYYMTCKRLIPHAKKGKKLYFLRTELDQWIAHGKRKMLSEHTNGKLKRE